MPCLLDSIICKREKIESKNDDRNEENISKDFIPKLDDMFRPEVSSDEHSDTKCNGKRDYILPLYHDSDEAPDKPKDRHSCRESLRHKGGKFDEKSIDKIIPNS